MKLLKACALILPAVLLAGCLEVDQHPPWLKGEYAGKPDDRHYQRRFHNDRLAWWATVENRNGKQNEYNRANP
ncbi:hypothetical protein ABIB42_000529 [Massilia sp. UYP32]|uniref:Lipoprotein n=2 Tax=Massilia timonae TaxID=47229 RepID=K9DFH8_9BURK|nr:hypothetical protein [Massilia timonae]EKU82036.1 hypothetical protein HMPREF9710_02729 [Massilia timonae CCUG 45783]OIJ44240.1 putative lipoprotein [Massilia timonae]